MAARLSWFEVSVSERTRVISESRPIMLETSLPRVETAAEWWLD